MTELSATTNNNGPSGQTSLYTTNGWWVLAGASGIYLFFTWYLQTRVLTDQVYYTSLTGQVSIEKLSALLDSQHRMSLLAYIGVPVFLVIKMVLVSFCLLTGLLLTARRLPFRTLCKIALFAESAFVAGTLLKLLLLAFVHNVDNLGQYASFAPLSLYSLFKVAAVPAWLTYPLQTLDLFQVGYVLLLATGLGYYCRQPFKKMLWLVLASYGTGLLCCMIGFAFLSFSYTN